jgi:hypothetical protein
MVRLYSNENFPFPVVQELRRLGYDITTVQETGLAGQAIADEAVLAFACQENRALITLNRKHFIRLHKESDDHCGIIVCTFDPNFINLAHRIHEAITAQANLFKQLIRINRPNP